MTQPTLGTIANPSLTDSVDWAAALVEHDRWLRTAVLARLRERQAVDEVMQEVALAAVGQKAGLSEPGKVGAWLYRIAIHKVLLHRRQRGRQTKLVDRFARRRLASGQGEQGPSPLDWLLRDERQSLVRGALLRLPGRDAEILLLKYTENWSYRELAEHLGIAVSAVESRLHRARHRLRVALAAADPVNEPEASP
jgi:RNA polymerase sigma-70 factor (ECF subfamily)